MENNIRDAFEKAVFLSMNFRRNSLNKIGLYPGQPIILLLIEENPGISQKSLAEYAKISRPTLNVMLTRLQKNGLVEIKYDKNNSKISKVYLTEEGNKKNRYAKEILDNLKDIYYIDFSDREKETFEKLLNKISNSIENKMKEEKNENA